MDREESLHRAIDAILLKRRIPESPRQDKRNWDVRNCRNGSAAGAAHGTRDGDAGTKAECELGAGCCEDWAGA